ncbi:hypothetical protein GCM10022631_26140 [Deinococcus rubellus]
MQIVPKFMHRLVSSRRSAPQPPKPEPQVPPKPELQVLPEAEPKVPPEADHTVDFDDLLRALGCDL